MSIRWILYGYKIENNKFLLELEEAKIVKKIFSDYINGSSFKRIADELTSLGVVYFGDKSTWNKNTVARIIENKNYIGTEKYPPIIDEDTYVAAEKKRSLNGGKRTPDKPEIRFIKNHIVCGCCGKSIFRTDRSERREKWACMEPDCKRSIFMDDKYLFGQIRKIYDSVFRNPSILETAEIETYSPDINVVKQENEIMHMCDRTNLQFKPIQKVLFELISDKFDCCTLDRSVAFTEHLKKYISETYCGTVNYELMKNTVSKITVDRVSNITVLFINGKEINMKGSELNAGTES